MPTMTLYIDCDKQPTEEELAELGSFIASQHDNFVLFEWEYSLETKIDWDKYMSQFSVLSA